MTLGEGGAQTEAADACSSGIIGLLGIIGAAAAGVFFIGGLFNVGAGWDDPAALRWALVQTRQASIARHAGEVGAPPVKLDDPAVVRAGAHEYDGAGCVNCHGGPGVEWQKFSEGLNPDPPELKEVAGMEPAQLFWVIKNGIRMTGMPSFGKAGVSDDDIWKIVAFVKKLPTVSAADYKAWTAPPRLPLRRPRRALRRARRPPQPPQAPNSRRALNSAATALTSIRNPRAPGDRSSAACWADRRRRETAAGNSRVRHAMNPAMSCECTM